MKIFLSVLEELNSDGEDSDLESEQIYFDNTKSLENFYQNSKFETICSFCEKWICKKHYTQICLTFSTKNVKIN